MFSIVRAEMPFESRIMNALKSDTCDDPIAVRRVITIRRINPEDFENGESDMWDEDDLTQEELDALEKEIPDEVDDMPDDFEDDLDEEKIDEDDITDEDLDELEKELPDEIDDMSDEDLDDEDLDDEPENEDLKNKQFKKGRKIDDYL
jgi:hypothetical protein